MARSALIGLSMGLLAVSALAADTSPSYKGLEVAVLGAERVSVYRDLTVKDQKKEDLLVVRLEVRWTAETRYILIEDGDLRVRDAGGRGHKCAFTFVQSTAGPADEKAVIEIPFRVKKDATIVSLELGKLLLPLKTAQDKQ